MNINIPLPSRETVPLRLKLLFVLCSKVKYIPCEGDRGGNSATGRLDSKGVGQRKKSGQYRLFLCIPMSLKQCCGLSLKGLFHQLLNKILVWRWWLKNIIFCMVVFKFKNEIVLHIFKTQSNGDFSLNSLGTIFPGLRAPFSRKRGFSSAVKEVGLRIQTFLAGSGIFLPDPYPNPHSTLAM